MDRRRWSISTASPAVQWIDSDSEAGFSPEQIVKAMIPTAAKLFGVEKERGAKPGIALSGRTMSKE